MAVSLPCSAQNLKMIGRLKRMYEWVLARCEFKTSFGGMSSWWRHQMETFSALLAICAGNSPVTGEFPTQRPVTRSFDVFFDLRQNKRLSKQPWGWWFETPSRPLWRHCISTASLKVSMTTIHTRTVARITNQQPWIQIHGLVQESVTPVRQQWSHVFLALTQRNIASCKPITVTSHTR